MTVMRARVSSDRFVSWVVSVVSACGHDACRRANASWNACGAIENCDGSPPTSFSDVSRL